MYEDLKQIFGYDDDTGLGITVARAACKRHMNAFVDTV
jgi:hypothetical protein